MNQQLSPWRLCVAPMMDWTDRHCRFFHRLLTRRARLYTEMVTTGALMHGDVARHLRFNAEEHPLALQLGGSEVADLAACARLAQQWGYDEVNLNIGCPSERVQRGAFGACLMAEPELVADGLKAMQDACSLPVTVKHRVGIDRGEDYGFVRDFVGTLAHRSACTVFIVHARNAWLQGLSPKENRELPPLRYEQVYRLKADFPALRFVINGGIGSDEQIAQHLEQVDGVMLGRHAYHEPFAMAGWDQRFFGDSADHLAGEPSGDPSGNSFADSFANSFPDSPANSGRALDRQTVEAQMVDYMQSQREQGTPWSHVSRHMLGLYNGLPGARRWRQVWSDHRLKNEAPAAVMALAQRAMQQPPAAQPMQWAAAPPVASAVSGVSAEPAAPSTLSPTSDLNPPLSLEVLS